MDLFVPPFPGPLYLVACPLLYGLSTIPVGSSTPVIIACRLTIPLEFPVRVRKAWHCDAYSFLPRVRKAWHCDAYSFLPLAVYFICERCIVPAFPLILLNFVTSTCTFSKHTRIPSGLLLLFTFTHSYDAVRLSGHKKGKSLLRLRTDTIASNNSYVDVTACRRVLLYSYVGTIDYIDRTV